MVLKLLNEEKFIVQYECMYFNDFTSSFYNAVIALDENKIYVFELNSADHYINSNLAISLPRFSTFISDISLIIDEKLYGIKKYKKDHRVTICDNNNNHSILLYYHSYQKAQFKTLYKYLKAHNVKVNYTKVNATKYI